MPELWYITEEGRCSRDEVLEALRRGERVWVDGYYGCVEGRCVAIEPDDERFVLRWNWGRYGRRSEAATAETALARAERIAGRSEPRRAWDPVAALKEARAREFALWERMRT